MGISASVFNDSRVTAFDVSQSRILTAEKLAKKENRKISLKVGILEELLFEDKSFDFVFCYSSIYFCNFDKTCYELTRVLKEKGKIYICSNGYGRYLKKIIESPNSTSDFSSRNMGIKRSMIFFGLNNSSDGDNIKTCGQLKGILKKNGIYKN